MVNFIVNQSLAFYENLLRSCVEKQKKQRNFRKFVLKIFSSEISFKYFLFTRTYVTDIFLLSFKSG